MEDPSVTFENILKKLEPQEVEFLRTVWTELGRANTDVGVLLNNLHALEDVTGECLEGEDAAIVTQIENERKQYFEEAAVRLASE